MRSALSAIVVFLVTQSALANESSLETIQWAVNDAPPFHVIDGPYQGLGICDVLIDAIHRALPDLRSSVWLMPQPRISAALGDGINLCFPCMIYKGSHDSQAYFSLPSHIYEPHQLITTKSKAAEISNRYGEPLAFEALLRDKQFRFGYPAGRRYGILQPLLEKYPPALARAGTGGAIAIMQMIKANRLDYTLDYAVVANYFQKTGQGELAKLALQENLEQPVAGAVGCARTDWGVSVLTEINKVMPEVRQDPAFIRVLELWAGDDAAAYLKFNQQYLALPQHNQSDLPAKL